MEHTTQQLTEEQQSASIILKEKPVIFDYVDYRAFLLDSLKYIQSKNSKYSATAYVRQAGCYGSLYNLT